jgi:hypothetical protein
MTMKEHAVRGYNQKRRFMDRSPGPFRRDPTYVSTPDW